MSVEERVTELSVNEVIRRYPAAVALFNRHGIDACCGGAAPVAQAAERDGADAAALVAELERLVEASG
jgi:regulator of cell morphogenesis and NO signaling